MFSLILSLTTSPMMCATLLRSRDRQRHGALYLASERAFDVILGLYKWMLARILNHPLITVIVLAAVVVLNVWMYGHTPNEFFPQQDTGRLSGSILADQNTSSLAMRNLLNRFASGTSSDPAVDDVIAFSGTTGGAANQGRMFVSLKPLGQRGNVSADQVIARLRGKLSHIPGATLVFQSVQDVRAGGRQSQGQYQYTLQGDNLKELSAWAPRMMAKLQTLPGLVDVSSDQQEKGLESDLVIDRATATRLGLTVQALDDTLYDAFGQRQVSTMYEPLNQYHVVMEVDPKFSEGPTGLRTIYANTPGGLPLPLSTFAHYEPSTSALSIAHQSQFPAITLSFNLRQGFSLGTAVNEIERAALDIGMPGTIHGKFAGTAQIFQDTLANQPLLIAAALFAVYIVLGMLYESTIHPITIISTLPSAGVGALLALNIFHVSFSVIAMIGVILLIGIVKKNAILMIDFALDAERKGTLSSKEAIFQACLLRFRPITMTTMAALLGGLPLALGTGVGSELRRPLGIAIVGGLILSQALTLFTTPVVYLYLDRFRLWCRREASGGLVAGIVAALVAWVLVVGVFAGAGAIPLVIVGGVGLIISVIGILLSAKSLRRWVRIQQVARAKAVAGVILSSLAFIPAVGVALWAALTLLAGGS